MATREELLEALRNADAAGATDDARRLADMLSTMDATPAESLPEVPQEQKDIANQLSMLSTTPLSMRSPEMNAETAAGQREQERQQNVDTFNAASPLAKAGVATYDTLSNLTDLFGLRDMAGSGVKSLITGQPYDEILGKARKDAQASADRAGWAGTAATVAGDMAALGPIARFLPTSRIPASAPAVTKAALAAPLAGLEGTVLGGLDAAGHGEDISEGASAGAISGLLAGPLGSLATSGVSKALGLGDDALRAWRGDAPRNTPRPDTQQMRIKKDAAYQDPDLKKTVYDPSTTQQLMTKIDEGINSRDVGASPHTTPSAWNFVKDMKKQLTSNPLSAKAIETERQLAGKRISPAEEDVATAIQSKLDEFINSEPPVVRGNAAEARKAVSNARDANRRFKNTEQLENDLYKSDLASDVSASGSWSQKVQSKLAAQLGKGAEGFNEAEKELMEKAARGTTLGKGATRLGTKLQNPLVSTIIAGGLGSVMGGGVGIPLGLGIAQGGGRLLTKLGDRSTAKSVNKLLNEVTGHPQTPRNTKAQNLAEGLSPDIIRLLELMRINQPPQQKAK